MVAQVKVEDGFKLENELFDEYREKQFDIYEGDGHTEFRTLNATEVVEILDYLHQEMIEGILNYPLS